MKRILIIRLSAIGDVTMASGLIPALRKRWPDAYLGWLVEPPAKGLLEHNPSLDAVIIWPKMEWKNLWKQRRFRALYTQVRQFTRELRSHQFNLALDTQGLLKSAVWARISGARERIGLGSKEGSSILMTKVVEKPSNNPRISSEYLRLAQKLGAADNEFPLDIAISDEILASVRALLAESGIEGGFALFCPFTTRPQKHWFEDRWSELAQLVPQRLGLPVVMLGGPDDVDAAQRICNRAGQNLINLVGKTSLSQAAAVASEASILIGVDTGLTHLGIAQNTPTLALFGSTRPYLDPATPNARVLYHAMDCSPCRRNPTCGGAFTCMKLHTVDSVLEAAKGLPRK